MKINTYPKSIFIGLLLVLNVNMYSQESPFYCDYDAYLFQYNDVYSIDLASGNSYLAASDITEGSINAVAYNPADGFIWGSLSSPEKTIVRIAQDYKVTTFNIPELPTINSSGVYFLKGGGTTYYKIDINPNSTTYTQHLATESLSQSISIHDWAFNAVDNQLYTVEKGSNILYRVNPANGVVQNLGEVPILSGLNYTYGAVYFDVSGRFYVSANQTGTIYAIPSVQDLDGTIAIQSNLFAFGPSSSSNDGARCPTAPVPQEICDNGIDDDGDGLIDCADASCSNIGECDVVTAPVSGANDGGLESNNRLSNQINKRNYNRVKSNYKFKSSQAKRVLKTQRYARKAASSEVSLANFIPLEVLQEDYVIESSPDDLTAITNATAVYAVDYFKNETSIASILALKTDHGVYEHTKYICDRLLGAELVSVSTIEIREQTFIKSIIRNSDGTKEFVLSFSAAIDDSTQSFIIESHWNLDKYSGDKSFYNFQIWSNSLDDLYRLGEEVLELLSIERSISGYNNSRPPTVFVKKGAYKNGYLNLEVINTNQTESVGFSAGLRETETESVTHVSSNLMLNSYVTHMSLETGRLFDIGFRIGDGIETPDDLFMSDGTWGLDDGAPSTEIRYYDVYQNTNTTDDSEFKLERNINLEALTREYVAVYRSLTPRFNPVDLSDYNTLNLKAKGTGDIEITLIKASIDDWEDQFKITRPLSEEMQHFVLPINEFRSSAHASLVGNDIVTIVFKMTSIDGASTTLAMNIEDVTFSKEEVLNVEELTTPEVLQGQFNYPNPFEISTTIQLQSVSDFVFITVVDLLGRTVDIQKLMTDASGLKVVYKEPALSKGIYKYNVITNHGTQCKGSFMIK